MEDNKKVQTKRTFSVSVDSTSYLKGDLCEEQALVSCHSWCQSQLINGTTGELSAWAAAKDQCDLHLSTQLQPVFTLFPQEERGDAVHTLSSSIPEPQGFISLTFNPYEFFSIACHYKDLFFM